MWQIILKIFLTILVLGVIWKHDVNINLSKFIEGKLPIYKKPIIITPDKISLRTKEWKEISTFNIYNSSDEILYNVYVKIQIENPQISVQNIDVLPQKDNDKVVVPSKDVSVTYDNLFIKGIDSKGKESIYLLIYSLDPKESRAFTINTIPSADLNTEQISVLVKLSKYSRKPARIIENSNKGVFINFNLPENFTVTGVKQRVKLNTPSKELESKLLRVLTKEEFDLFAKLAENRTFILGDSSHYFVLLSDKFLKESAGIRREDINLLVQIGLIVDVQLKIVKGSTLICDHRGWSVYWPDDQERVLAVISLTRFGKELTNLIKLKCDNSYIDNVISLLNANKINVQLIAVSDFKGGSFKYDDLGFYGYK